MFLNNFSKTSIYALLDRNGNFLKFSENYAILAEVDESFLGHNHFDIFTNEPQNRGIFKQVVETGIPHLIHSKSFKVGMFSNQVGEVGNWCFIPFFASSGEVDQVLISYVNVDEDDFRKILKTEIDPLTGLLNRRGFERAIEPKLKNKEKFTLLFLDLNGFKPVNDIYGHDVGDILLSAVGKRISSCFKSSDLIARLGGDEFVIALEGWGLGVENIVSRIEKQLNNDFHINDNSIRVGTSIGCAFFPTDGDNLKELLKKADELMYADKKKRKGR